MQTIFDGPLDILNGEPGWQPGKLPNLVTAALFTPVAVAGGDVVINTAGYLVSLQAGVQVFPSGCTTAACSVTWDGTAPLQMDQLTAVFKLKPGLTWSDGQPLKASDSVYSFNASRPCRTGCKAQQ
jgi:peptide/nickel transport system substrate-binding protein